MPDWPNGLIYYSQADIDTREYLIRRIAGEISDAMRSLNRGIDFVRIETPCLIPWTIAQPHLLAEFPLWQASPPSIKEGQLWLRPESTHGTYTMFHVLFPEELRLHKVLPLCLWQAGLSFRVEQDKTFKNMRFKQFYQLEFQLAYAEGTKANYHEHAVGAMFALLERLFPQWLGNMGCIELEDQEEIPFYSERTTDLTVLDHEVVAISSRTDFDYPVLEISCGLDRLLAIYQHQITS
jgi:glycyl-tRNA synthetase